MSDIAQRTALAIWGDPVEHSRSPDLHRAAYAALGLDWTYTRRRVGASDFPDALRSLDSTWRGLSCTMPLKEEAFAAAVTRDRGAELTRAVNTLRFSDGHGPEGINTDIGGLVRAIRADGVEHITHARLIGAGKTAGSAVVALAELGARRIDVHARRAESVRPLTLIGAELDVQVRALPLDGPGESVEVTVATLPGGTVLPGGTAERLAEDGGLLVDVSYDPWPSDLAVAWMGHGHPASNGLGMLLHQAVLQVRFFVTGNAADELPNEARVVEAMQLALAS